MDAHARFAAIGAGHHIAMHVHHGNRSQKGQTQQRLVQRSLHALSVWCRGSQNRRRRQRIQRHLTRLQRARGLVFQHPGQQCCMGLVGGNRAAKVTHRQQDHCQQRAECRQGPAHQHQGAGLRPTPQCSGRSAGRCTCAGHAYRTTIGPRPWLPAARSSRPSRLMRATKSSTVASHLASPGLTA